VPELWKAVTKTRNARAEPQPGAGKWLIWRRDLQIYFRPVAAAEAAVIAASRAGQSFGELCVLLCEHLDETEAAAQCGRIFAWLGAVGPHRKQEVSTDAPQICNNVLEMIGNTPLIAVRHLDTGAVRAVPQARESDPGGSIKDRIGLYLIEAAEREARSARRPAHRSDRGQHRPGLALVAGQKGYRLLLVIPTR